MLGHGFVDHCQKKWVMSKRVTQLLEPDMNIGQGRIYSSTNRVHATNKKHWIVIGKILMLGWSTYSCRVEDWRSRSVPAWGRSASEHASWRRWWSASAPNPDPTSDPREGKPGFRRDERWRVGLVRETTYLWCTSLHPFFVKKTLYTNTILSTNHIKLFNDGPRIDRQTHTHTHTHMTSTHRQLHFFL